MISLVWALELVIDGQGVEIVDLTIAPLGVEIQLDDEEWLALDAPWDRSKPSWIRRLEGSK